MSWIYSEERSLSFRAQRIEREIRGIQDEKPERPFPRRELSMAELATMAQQMKRAIVKFKPAWEVK